MKKFPPYLPVLTVLTCIYLAFELGFNARLLDVAGSNATNQAIENIEWWGRVISGLALALAVCGMGVMPYADKHDWSFTKQVIACCIATGLCVGALFNGEKSLIDKLADSSDGQTRGIAARLGILNHGILSQDIKLDGIDLDREQLSRPEGKAFSALLPVLAFTTTDLDRKAHDATNTIVRNMVATTMGSTEYHYNTVFLPSADGMRDAYNRYATASNSLGRTLDGIPAQQDRAWSQYVSRLSRNRWTPSSVPPMAWGRVRLDVRQQGVVVQNDWVPRDQQRFYQAVRQGIETEAWNGYDQGVERELGQGAKLAPGLQRDEFFAQPAVQKKWRRELGIDQPGTLRLNESPSDFTALSYVPKFDRLVRETMANYEAQDATFANGKSREKFGKDAMRALLVPPIALGFSLVGGLVHIGKLFDCVFRFLPGRRSIKGLAILGVLATAVLAVFLSPNPVSSSRVFGAFQRQINASFGWPLERALTWVVQAQPYAYPINEAIRIALPGDVTYGYEPDASHDQMNSSPMPRVAQRGN